MNFLPYDALSCIRGELGKGEIIQTKALDMHQSIGYASMFIFLMGAHLMQEGINFSNQLTGLNIQRCSMPG